MVKSDINVIIKKEDLAEKIVKLVIYNPQIALNARAGQFVIIRVVPTGERIPLTIADSDKKAGSITLISMTIGKTTALVENMREGEKVIDVLGPLGKCSEIEKFGHVVCIGGGLGIAPVFPILKEIKNAGNTVTTIIGARNEKLLILEDEMKVYSDNFFVCTDDGSKGFRGFVSAKLKELIMSSRDKSSSIDMPDRVIAIGPTLMMKSVCDVTRDFGIKTTVSLNSVMIDGTGMCGACRVEVGGDTKFACVDGPEFDGHLVNFDLLLARQNYFCEEEQLSMEGYKKENHTGSCKLDL